MRSCCCAHCSLGCEGSRACAQWCRFPSEADEDARRCVRERTELISERVGFVNRIGAVLATLGASDYNPLLRIGAVAGELRTALGDPLPPNARAKIVRMLDRLELVLAQIADWSVSGTLSLKTEAPDKAGKMIQQLASPARHRRSERDRAGAGGVCPWLRQWQGTRIVRRSVLHAIQQRWRSSANRGSERPAIGGSEQ